VARVDCFLLADSAQVANGKLYMLGGGWARLTVPQVPDTRPFEIAVRVIVSWTETNRPLHFHLQLENEDGETLLNPPVRAQCSVGRPVHLREGTDQVVPFTFKLNSVTIAKPGRYAFTLEHEGETVARTAFDVVVKAAPKSSPVG
jgi:hypothetical protein